MNESSHSLGGFFCICQKTSNNNFCFFSFPKNVSAYIHFFIKMRLICRETTRKQFEFIFRSPYNASARRNRNHEYRPSRTRRIRSESSRHPEQGMLPLCRFRQWHCRHRLSFQNGPFPVLHGPVHGLSSERVRDLSDRFQ